MQDVVQRLFETLADVNLRFAGLVLNLNQRAEVLSVQRGLDFRRYQDFTAMEGFVDAELHNGTAIGCWIDVRPAKEKIILRRSIRTNREIGEDIETEFEELEIGIEQLRIIFPEAVQELIDKMKIIDLKTI